MQAADYKYSQRQYVYRDEPQCFRSLPATTRSLGEYFRKSVDPDGGWLQLRGLSPVDAVRRAGFGFYSRGDFRNIKRAVNELLEVGYFALGELDEDGRFLPLGSGDYLAIRDWIPSQRGMSRKETAAYYADQEERAARYLARLHAEESEDHTVEPAPVAKSDAVPIAAAASNKPSRPVDASRVSGRRPSEPVTVTLASANGGRQADDVAHKANRERIVATPKRTRKRSTAQRQCIDKSASTGNSKGTELAVFHTIPFRNPPKSPKGEREALFDSASPPTSSATLATLAIEWLNQQRTTPTHFQAENPDMQRKARQWQKAGWDWQLLRKALDLRLASLKAANPDGWENWVTPARLFDRRLRHFVHEALSGHSYRPTTPRRNAATDAVHPPPALYDRATERARADRLDSAERAFADVLTVAGMVGPNGDWRSKLRHATARRVIRAIGWKRIVEGGEAIHDHFLARYLGGSGYATANAAA